MTSRSIDIYELKIPLEAINKLSNEERFSYYLLGHIFNELMSLQKLVGFALPKHDDSRPQRLRPEHAQAMFLFRLAGAKIWEAIIAIRETKELALTLKNLVLPRMTDGSARLKTLNSAINAAGWLSPMRNGIGFHFPTFKHWESHIIPDSTWEDDHLFLGTQSGNTFYDAADSVAQSWMFSQYGASNVREAIDPLIGQMIELLGAMNTFVEDALGVFISSIILEDKGNRRHVGKVLAPHHEKVSIPFWTSMPERLSV
jgi:hypothetical protein